MIIVQIKGTNGSGKTTIAKQMLSISDDVRLYYTEHDDQVVATVLNDLSWAVVGEYKLGSKMGGCDNLKTVAQIKDYIEMTIIRYPELHGILFEGMMISTITSTFYDFLMRMKHEYGIEPLFVHMNVSLQGCLDRIAARGTMKHDLNVNNISNKIETISKGIKSYDKKYVRTMYVDAIPVDEMLERFLRLVGDLDLANSIYY